MGPNKSGGSATGPSDDMIAPCQFQQTACLICHNDSSFCNEEYNCARSITHHVLELLHLYWRATSSR